MPRFNLRKEVRTEARKICSEITDTGLCSIKTENKPMYGRYLNCVAKDTDAICPLDETIPGRGNAMKKWAEETYIRLYTL